MNSRRIILGTHYDSIVRAYRDPENPQGPMPGANNSASGVACTGDRAGSACQRAAADGRGRHDLLRRRGGAAVPWRRRPQLAGARLADFVTHLPTLYANQTRGGRRVRYGLLQSDQAQAGDVFAGRCKAAAGEFWKIGEQVAPSIFVSKSTGYPISDDQIALSQAGFRFLVIGSNTSRGSTRPRTRSTSARRRSWKGLARPCSASCMRHEPILRRRS